MTELLTAARMRAIESAAIKAGEVSGLALMERAGRGVVEAIFLEWPELAERGASPSRSPGYLKTKDQGKRAVVLCGPGNNGGDGFVVARLLRQRGWEVAVFLYGVPGKLPADARANYQRWCSVADVRPLHEAMSGFAGDGPDLVVDAIFGTGLTRPLADDLDDVLRDIRSWQERRFAIPATVAVDIPSGLCSDSGRDLRGAGRNNPVHGLTVTFHRARPGHYLQKGPECCGKVRVVDIGLPTPAPGNAGSPIALRRCQPAPILSKRAGHKYLHGHALILSGGPGRTGAARLAARGALRIGAGLVSIGVPPSAQMEVAGQITAIMLRRVADGDALRSVLEDLRINALCLGPGMGRERARVLVPEALGTGRGVVLDADVLRAYAGNPAALFAMLHENCVLTPHGGEFARLFPDLAGKLAAIPARGPAYSKVDATREAAARAGCVVLYKGPDTVIAAPDGRCSINSAQYERAAPWLATAGSGDVLAGFITGLLARGISPMQAAESAACLHVECALSFGPGLIAEDIPEVLPRVLRTLGV